MKTLTMLLIAATLGLAACDGDDDQTAGDAAQSNAAAMEKKEADTAAMEKKETDTAAMEKKETDTAAMEKKEADTAAMEKGEGTTLALGESEFGEMLFDDKKQAIYIFEQDPKGETTCYGECAEAWPPVFTDGEPVAAKGAMAALLGTVKRRDGKLQVTYAGKPLYYYAHEGPGEVRCHNVNLNGGFWWVVGADGKRLA